MNLKLKGFELKTKLSENKTRGRPGKVGSGLSRNDDKPPAALRKTTVRPYRKTN